MKLQCTIMSRGKITHTTQANHMHVLEKRVLDAFPDVKILRYTATELVMKSGNEPITIIIAPIC
jgi:cobalamin biosynthesis Co2+ chelatase CbiK